jgi:hypothetical protein
VVFYIIKLFACKVFSVMAAIEAWCKGGRRAGTGGVDFGYEEREKELKKTKREKTHSWVLR